jgi:hypothetical protein
MRGRPQHDATPKAATKPPSVSSTAPEPRRLVWRRIRYTGHGQSPLLPDRRILQSVATTDASFFPEPQHGA